MKKIERTVNIDRFIATYDGYITQGECNKAIQLFEQQTKFNKTVNRQDFEKTSVVKKQDQQFFASAGNITAWHTDLKILIANFDIALKHYLTNTGINDVYDGDQFKYTSLKIQKTLPTEGYHVWHIEHGAGFENAGRVLVYSVYLNDVEEGGETEFLHFSKRIKPKTGRIVIWPSGFPYVHRGNPPLKGEKYLLTSWMMLR
tara:strand:- start:1132 stop:1734 length:603 start_codon:yes stop_codon:yes gene_type:complete